MLERDCLPELLALPEAISPPLTRAHVPSPLHMFTCAAELGGSVQEGAPLGADPPRFGGFGAILSVAYPSRCSNQGRRQGEYFGCVGRKDQQSVRRLFCEVPHRDDLGNDSYIYLRCKFSRGQKQTEDRRPHHTVWVTAAGPGLRRIRVCVPPVCSYAAAGRLAGGTPEVINTFD